MYSSAWEANYKTTDQPVRERVTDSKKGYTYTWERDIKELQVAPSLRYLYNKKFLQLFTYIFICSKGTRSLSALI